MRPSVRRSPGNGDCTGQLSTICPEGAKQFSPAQAKRRPGMRRVRDRALNGSGEREHHVTIICQEPEHPPAPLQGATSMAIGNPGRRSLTRLPWAGLPRRFQRWSGARRTNATLEPQVRGCRWPRHKETKRWFSISRVFAVPLFRLSTICPEGGKAIQPRASAAPPWVCAGLGIAP